MNFLTPAAFALSLLLPLIVLLYLLKLRRIERKVSSTYLWRRMVRDLEANAPWQRLRFNLLLLLQLLFLAALILALSRPYTWSEESSSRALILIVDTSASMAATDVMPSRLEGARQHISQLLGGLAQDLPVTLISAGTQARVLASSSLDRRYILQQIQELAVEMGPSDMLTALQLASAIAARQPETMIEVYTDGGAVFPQKLQSGAQLHIVLIGTASDNQAVSLLRLEPAPAGQALNAFIQLVNYSQAEVQRRLRLTLDGQAFQVMDVTLPARDEISLLVDGIPADIQVLEAQLLAGEQAVDYLPADDRAVTVNRLPPEIQVNLVTPGNRFIETALSLLPGVQLTRTDPASAGQLPQAVITIIDAALPLTTTLPAGNLFFIAPLRSTEFFTVTGILDHPLPLLAPGDPELMRNISLSEVNILDAVAIPLPDYAEPLFGSAGEGSQADFPLLFVGETGGRKLAVLAFSLQHSDLPLQVAFPLLLANLVGWLAEDQLNNLPVQVEPGNPVAINLPMPVSDPPSGRRVVVTRPDGISVDQQVSAGSVVFADTHQTGIYTVKIEDEEAVKFAVNLSSARESDITPSSPAVESMVDQASAGSPLPYRNEWWRTIALLALALLMLEWLVFHRSSLAYLAGKLILKR